jgi:hypothetical protein
MGLRFPEARRFREAYLLFLTRPARCAIVLP